MAKALEGDDRPAQVFTLTQSLALYDCTHQHIAACDQDIERVLSTWDSLVDLDAHPLPPPTTAHRQPQRHAPAFARRSHLYRITGVDLTHVPGLQALTIHIVLAEVGLNRPPWPTDKPCASWLGRCPDNQISGGTVLSTGSRWVHNRASRALRLAAQSLRNSPSSLGAFFRRDAPHTGASQSHDGHGTYTRKHSLSHAAGENTLSGTRCRFFYAQRARAEDQTMTQARKAPGMGCGAAQRQCIPKKTAETVEKKKKTSPMRQDETETYVHNMSEILRSPSTVQAGRPTCHWWLCPRVFAWFRVRMVWSLVKPPASAGPLSRIGDYLLAARGPGLCLWIRRRPTFPHASAATRGPPSPLFHRRWSPFSSAGKPTTPSSTPPTSVLQCDRG